MKKILIHTGTNKTGSTSIQVTMERSHFDSVLYLENDPEIAKFGRGFVAAVYREAERMPNAYKVKYKNAAGQLEADRRAWRARVAAILQERDAIMFSSEYLMLLNAAEVERLKTDFSAAGPARFRVLAYVRDPVSHYLSHVQQRVRHARWFGAPRYHRYAFREMIEAWEKAFPSVVLVKKFHRPVLEKGCVVQDFLSVASEFFETSLQADSVEDLNPSLSAEGTWIMQRYNCLFGEEIGSRSPDVITLLRILKEQRLPFESPLLLKQWVVRLVRKRHGPDLKWLRSRFGIEFEAPAKVPGTWWRTHDSASPKLPVEAVLAGIDREKVERRMLSFIRDFLVASPDPTKKK